MKFKYVVSMLAVAGTLAAGAAHAAVPVADPLTRPATMVRQPGRVFLAGLAHAGKRLVAVGEHGVVALSDDGGKSWRQARVPTSVTLTAVQFPTPRQGWATGHYGVVLHSADGGETWSRQLDGVQAAQLALRDAQAETGAPRAARDLADAQRLVRDGPDKPFLALHFGDALNGIVVGAYNLAFRTRDGGKTWTSLMGRLDNPKGNHLYAVRSTGDVVYIAGEQGLLLRATDGGLHFERLDTGYKGSFFALCLPGADEVVVGGLRGNAYRSRDRGASWNKLESPTPAAITAIGVRGADGIVAVNQAGQVLAAGPGATALVPLNVPALPPLNDLLVDADGSIIAASVFGVLRLPAVAPSAAPTVSMAAK
ncbi:WD40/YVTN/BNR-like repeat-containing protein [Massilia putida]|uniref:WD40/YVTN/BNR-like repeat-containing protein n=1 Tax=Massilia putida TaxID=1141883 RepID=UPI000952ED3E|nr:YCF48-related protein [Massilia putida]